MIPNPQKKKALFLNFELAGYYVACLHKLVDNYPVEAHVICYPVNAVAPFKININSPEVILYQRNSYNPEQLLQLALKIQPDFIFCSGWSDKGYIAVCKYYKNKVPSLVFFDNPWRNTLKQHLGRIVGQLYLTKIFDKCWVPGPPQTLFAKKMGFKDHQIKEGVYSADLKLFESFQLEFSDAKKKHFPKKFIFVGRYTKLKGVKELWEAFIRLQKEMPNDWELWCLGKGDYDAVFPQHEKIKNFGFVQPEALKSFIEQTGVFVLPSQYEHWGVVVHEFAAAGFPLMCSNTTSAAHAFLENGKNGYFHQPYSVKSICDTFKKFVQASDKELNRMAEHSVVLSRTITPDTWAATAWSYIASK